MYSAQMFYFSNHNFLLRMKNKERSGGAQTCAPEGRVCADLQRSLHRRKQKQNERQPLASREGEKNKRTNQKKQGTD
ncbi:hypothetical protein AOLI_G00168660 [Acnodon oligacanthus]